MAEEEIDLMGPEPLKIQIAEVIAKRIARGTYPPRRPIPGEHLLAEEFSVSRPTIRDATQILVDQGKLQRVQGKGTFVIGPKSDDEEIN